MAKALDRGYQGDLFGHTLISGGEFSSCTYSERIQQGRFFLSVHSFSLVVLSVM